MSQSEEPESSDRNRTAGAVLVLLGVVSIVAHVPALSTVASLSAILLTVVLPSILGVVIVGIGLWVVRGTLIEPEDAYRLVGWAITGMVVFMFVGVWILVLDRLLGEPVPYGYLITVNAVTLGGVAGVVIGLYDAQSREYTRRLKERERELTAKNERLDEFVSIVSHDLRNPLSVAKARLDLAMEDPAGEHLGRVERALERMEALIDDMLQLARQNESILAVETISLESVMRDAWQHVDTAQATLEVEGDMTIDADRSRVQQLFENLLRNAIEHGGRDVTITLGELPGTGGFYVEDDGTGIPSDARDQVFESGYSSIEDGTGFGLSIVAQIVDAHDWEVDVTEGSEGGARFEISF